jgi:hypothetical protein
MPDPFERRSRANGCCEGWYSQPPRSQLRSDAIAAGEREPARKAPARKDPALCKAAHWKGPHQPELRLQQYGWRPAACKWAFSWRKPGEPSWCCSHEEVCSGCGKILRTGIDDAECPGYHPITDGERDALYARRREEQARIAEARAHGRWQPKPPVTGPQGYRRPKAGKA